MATSLVSLKKKKKNPNLDALRTEQKERSEMTIVTSEVLHTGISQIYIFSADHSVKHVDTHAISITNIQHTY